MTIVGLDRESIATCMSPYDRCAPWSYSVWFGMVNSPHFRKPKNARQQAAHNRILLCFRGPFSRTAFILDMISQVMGSLVTVGVVTPF